jgi:hypothetical protein
VSHFDEWLLCLCLSAAQEQLAVTQDRVVRMRGANAVLAEQVMEAERDRDVADRFIRCNVRASRY